MSKKSKLDLLVRVRYQNPIPQPPFPPKLFNVPTDIYRLGEPSYLNQLASSAPLPMLVDSEMGMPIELNAFDGVWDGNDSSLNPVADPSRVYEPADIELLAPLKRQLHADGTAKVPTVAEVSWMRNSNYITRKGIAAAARRREAAEKEEQVDASEAAQLMTIDKTFADLHDQSAESMKHPDPKRKHLTVVESYDILPDNDSWPNSYILIRFPERPSAATTTNPSATASDARLRSAVLRPIMEDDQQIMEYFLPTEEGVDKLSSAYEQPADDETLDKVKELAQEDPSDPKIEDVFPSAQFDRIRTYEVVTQKAPEKEVLVTFTEDDGAQEDEEDMFGEPVRKKRKGVYFKEITMRTLLRKTRAKARNMEANENMWDKMRVGYRVPAEDEVAARESARSQVTDPDWVNEALRQLHGGDNQTEGLGEAIDDEQPLENPAESDED